MNYRPMLLVNGLLVLAMGGVTAWAWEQIPEGTQIPVHFGFDGTPDRYGSKEEGLLLLPVITAALTALFWFVTKIDPRKDNVASSGKFWNAVAISMGLFMAYTHVLLVSAALGSKIDMVGALVPGLSVLAMAIGNYMGKARSNWFGGVKTPWTLSSDVVWAKTHRLAGYLFMLTGLAGLAAWMILPAPFALMVVTGGMCATGLIAVVASYVYWRADQSSTSAGS